MAAQLTSHDLRVETDLRNEKIGYKIREHSLAKVPVLMVVGKREAQEGTVSLRRLGRKDTETLSLREAVAQLESEVLRSANAPRRALAGDGSANDAERIVQAIAE